MSASRHGCSAVGAQKKSHNFALAFHISRTVQYYNNLFGLEQSSKSLIQELRRSTCQLKRVEITTQLASGTVGGGFELGMTVASGGCSHAPKPTIGFYATSKPLWEQVQLAPTCRSDPPIHRKGEKTRSHQ